MGCCSSTQKPPTSGLNGFDSATGIATRGPYQSYQPQSTVPTQKVTAPQTQIPSNRNQPQPPPTAEHPPSASAFSKPAVATPRTAQHHPDTILGRPYDDIKKYYTLGKELGRGQFGITYLCTENSTGQTYACKSILKRKLISKNDKDDMKREILILQHLSGQPNIVEFKGAYEDRYSVHLVMELCAGGELFDRIIAQGQYSEKAAAEICRAIVNVVQICHFMGVMHRDLKPENFLLSSKKEGAMLKATDFGLSVFIEEGSSFCFLFPSCIHLVSEQKS